jgi:hypothetical protein
MPKRKVVHKYDGLHHLCYAKGYRKGFKCCNFSWRGVTCSKCLRAKAKKGV